MMGFSPLLTAHVKESSMDISNFSQGPAVKLLAGLIALGGCALSSCGANSPSGTGNGGSLGTNANGSGGSRANTGGSVSSGGSTAAGGGTSAGGGGSSGGTGPVTGVGGATGLGGTGATSADGATVVQKLCAQKVVAMNPVITDFETYNGMVDIAQYGFAFGGALPGTGTAYGGPYGFSGVANTGTINYALSFVAGHTGNWAVSYAVTNETVWGGGMGFWLNCVNASAYRGISFWVRGQTISGFLAVALPLEDTSLPDAVNPAGGGTCIGTDVTCVTPSAINLPVTLDWQQYMLPWTMFTGGLRAGAPLIASGDNIVGLVFSSSLNYVANPLDGGLPPYVPVPGDLTFQIDEISFLP
jgi:hypothetical protein